MTPLQTCYSIVAKACLLAARLLFFVGAFPVQQTTNSLLLRNRESARKRLKIRNNSPPEIAKTSPISAFTLYLPCKRKTAKETGSHVTAHTTTRSRDFAFSETWREKAVFAGVF
jgi:hypothetical protein